MSERFPRPAAFLLALFLAFPGLLFGQDILPPQPSHVIPWDVLPDEPTAIFVYGDNFKPETRITIPGAGDLIDAVFYTDGTTTGILGKAPPLPEGDPNHPTGLKDVVASDDRGTGTLQQGILYVKFGAAYLKDVAPSQVGLVAGTRIEYHGRNFNAGMEPWIATDSGASHDPLTDPEFVDENTLRGTLPDLAETGYHTAEVRSFGDITAERKRAFIAFESTAPPTITSVEPAEINARTGTAVEIHGENFRDPGIVPVFYVTGPGDFFVGYISDEELVSESLIRGLAPAIDPLNPSTPLGLYDLRLTDPRGNPIFRDALRYVDHIRSVTPGEVSAFGGSKMVFEGYGFEEGWTPRIGGEALLEVVYVSAERVEGTLPPVAPGILDADFVDSIGQVVGYLPAAVTVVNPAVSIASVEPAEILSAGGAAVTFLGDGFFDGLTPRLGGVPLIAPSIVSGGQIAGFSPEFPLGGTLDADLIDGDGTVVALLPAAVTVVTPPLVDVISLLGPNQVEGSLAEGTARFVWNNPVIPESILVTDAQGALLDTLPGDSRLYQLAVGADRDQVPVFLQSVFADGSFSDLVRVVAQRGECDWPPPLTGFDQKGKLDLTINGGRALTEPARCVAAGEFIPIPNLADLGLKNLRDFALAQPIAGGGSLIGADFVQVGAATGVGSLMTNGTIEKVAALETKYPGIFDRLTKHLVTGFTLGRDSDKLQIDAYYQMSVFALDLKLKGRLIHVFPSDGFVDDFTFPEVPVSISKDWNGITYFRADRDLLDPEAKGCGLKIPQGDYLLELSAEGGDPDTAHFIFQGDGRNEEILIPGVPCPPYPRVKVTDLTGKRSLPIITSITGQELPAPTINNLQFSFVLLTAHGYWIDENNREHSIDPADSLSQTRPYIPYDFELNWTVNDETPPTVVSAKGTNKILIKRPGCYEVDLAIRDPDCPRKVSSTWEVVVFPLNYTCNSPYYSVVSPMPDPSRIRAVGGFGSNSAGQGTPPGRKESLRVFVVPKDCCNGGTNCPAPEKEDLQFRLVSGGRVVYSVPDSVAGQPNADVEDLCEKILRGPKYLKVKLSLDQVALLAGADEGNFVEVQLEARTRQYRDPALNGTPRATPDDGWHAVGPPMHMTNRPPILAHSNFSSGYTKKDSAYRFLVEASEGAAEHFDQIHDSNSRPILSGVLGAVIPSFPSKVNTALNTSMSIVNGGKWQADNATSSMAGTILGNQLDGLPIDTVGKEISGQLPSQLRWEWSDQQELFSKHFQQTLFDSLIYTGVIVVVPVSVWGSISLALDLDVTASESVKISPFDALQEGGHYFQSNLDLTTKLDVSLPAELRTDVFFGIASLTLSAEVKVDSGFRASLRTLDTQLRPYLNLFVNLNVSLGAKLCFFWYLCNPPVSIPIIKNFEMINQTINPGNGGGWDDEAESPPSPLRGGGALLGGGGIQNQYTTFYELLTVPATAVIPDGNAVLNFYYSALNERLITELSTLEDDGTIHRWDITVRPEELKGPGPFDLSAACIRNDRALLLATSTYPFESAAPYPFDPDTIPSRENLNELKAQDEVILCRLDKNGAGFWGFDFNVARLADPKDEVAPQDRRADGRPAIAGNARFEDAIAAWVRMEAREFLVDENSTTTVYEPDAAGGEPTLHPVEKHTVRPRLETAAIYTRRVNWDGALDASRKISTGGINVEPAISFSPSGNEAYCVWVNDSVHLDLIASNRGRNLVYSVWTRATDSWSAPQPVIANIDDFPGVLEPSIALKGDGRGLLAFNALPKDAAERDSGLNGSNRFVYLSRLEGGVFGPPTFVHGFCGERIAGRYQTINLGPPKSKRSTKDGTIVLKDPDWVMFIQETGPLGSQQGAGNALVAVMNEGQTEPTPAVAILSDGRTHTNVVGAAWNGGLQVLDLKGPIAQVGAGGGGGVPADSGYEVLDVELQPDLSISVCKLTDQFPGAGARVKATVEVENRGLTGSPTDANGQSLAGVRIVYRRVDGTETVEGTAELPVLVAGEKTSVEFDLELPLDPVRLRAEISPNPGDPNAANDSRECFFGAPQPTNFTCSVFFAPNAEQKDLAVGLRWSNPVLYDELNLFRDGTQIAAIQGSGTAFVDHSAAPGIQHLYELRSQIGVSKSCRVKLDCIVIPPVGGARFRRGDSNGDGLENLSDAVYTLGYLFLGNPAALPCAKAADADDTGALNISDAVFLLSYLFLGSREPPAPFPECGADATVDDLECGGPGGCPR